jgi:serine/threonine protein phosphatase PrpC
VGAGSSGFIVNSYGGYSKKGYAPYNPKKKNQDALIMAEDPKTRSLLFCVMDGHGEDGDKVSQSIKSKLANYLFKHRDFATDIKAALTDVIARCEAEVLRGERIFIFCYFLPDNISFSEPTIETDFSGTTFTCAVIRNNKCVLCNIGDSRTSLGYRNESGGIAAKSLTLDHKPDLPAEKVSVVRVQAK